MRCYNPKNPSHSGYGGRGIRVYEKWHNYIGFLEDMGPTWRYGLSLERLNNDGNYTPANCVWATREQQANNRRTNRKLTVNGVSLTVIQWARRQGLKPATLYARLDSGWNPEDAIKPC